jgi:hypothetical protein
MNFPNPTASPRPVGFEQTIQTASGAAHADGSRVFAGLSAKNIAYCLMPIAFAGEVVKWQNGKVAKR